MENIYLIGRGDSKQYSVTGRGRQIKEPKDREEHSKQLVEKLEVLTSTRPPLGNDEGMYIDVHSFEEQTLSYERLVNRQEKVKLLNIRKEKIELEDRISSQEVATIYLPKGKEDYLLKRVNQYIDTLSRKKIKNKNLVDSIKDVSHTQLDSFFKPEELAGLKEHEKKWFEVWIDTSGKPEVKENSSYNEEEFIRDVKKKGIKISSRTLKFPESTIYLVNTDKAGLKSILSLNSVVMEFRKAAELTTFYLDDLEAKEQKEWIDELVDRIIYVENEKEEIVINIIDTGIRDTHPLLEKSISSNDMVSYMDEWGLTDDNGHGTLMAGVALYNDLEYYLSGNETYELRHRLESSKILDSSSRNPSELYGDVINQVIAKQVLKSPVSKRIRIHCMAVTSSDTASEDGSPTSWSAATDSTIYGDIDNEKKLFFISAGNIRENIEAPSDDYCYTAQNKVNSIEDPGQAWNAITVGAYTEKIESGCKTYNVVAPKGGLSPYSRTSSMWERIWPIKPEIVLEGGNLIHIDGVCYSNENLSSLTLNKDYSTNYFDYINATSEATARASWMASQIISDNPKLWPETVRALIIHSAEWTEALKEQFLQGSKKEDYLRLLRTCGYGVPDIEKVRRSTKNNVNMIIEEEIQPYKVVTGKPKYNEFHYYELPWPKDLLLSLGDKKVELRVTLSYYIAPNLNKTSWGNNYDYPSALLGFDMNGTIDKETFLADKDKINFIKTQGERVTTGKKVDWIIGPKQRDVGSIHSDIWVGSAAMLAESNIITIYPKSGWWKNKEWLGKGNEKIRYSLIVTLSTQEDVDLYTPIVNEIQAPIEF